ncbi:MAG: hypothetical protein IPK60_22980 [Sandaracinaceae bacterium]|nr:hypothetical protein [Sandaracinaceae bacterium]
MAITSIDDIVSGLASQQRIPFMKVMNSAKAAGAWVSGWKAGGFPGAGSDAPAYTAGSGYACDSSTSGAAPYSNASAVNWIARLTGSASVAGTIILYDRLWSCSGMGFAASTYTVTTPGSLPARITDGGIGCEIWIEQFVAAGTASGTVTVTYLDYLGNSSTGVSPTVASAPTLAQMQPVRLQVGALGVSQIVSAQNSATWTSGSYGITVMKRIAEIPINVAGINDVGDWAQVLTSLPDDVCIGIMYHATTTTGAVIMGAASIIDK